jgi:hypothetical protein
MTTGRSLQRAGPLRQVLLSHPWRGGKGKLRPWTLKSSHFMKRADARRRTIARRSALLYYD